MSKTDTGSATALTADVVMKEARERVYRDSDDDATGNVVGFAEWICDRLPLSSAAPSESRAGALTAEQFERIACSAASDAGRIPGANLYNAAKFACDEIRQLLAASPVEQHDQLAHGWKVRPVAFCDSATNEAGATVAWMHVDDPRECVSDAKKRDMIEHAGAPGARLAAKFSIALGKLPSA